MKDLFSCFTLIGASLMLSLNAAEVKPGSSIAGLWLMGQSLCDGSESLPVVTTGDTGWGNYAFQCGVRTWLPKNHSATPEKRPAEQFQWVPLRAQTNGGLGETVANGLADHLKAALMGMKQGIEKNGSPHFLVACAGQGGRQIQELSSADLTTDPRTPESRRHGGGYYRTSLDDARRATAQARAQGMSFEIQALYWMQGEGNGGPTGGIVPTRWDPELPRPQGQIWYRDQLIAYRRQWSADLCAITGQHGELPMFTYQTLGPAGDAQLMAADADAAIHLVGPHYAVPSAINSRTTQERHGDAIHLSADGERWWGEQVGKVMHRVMHRGEDWQPLRPRSAGLGAARDGLSMEFTVPRPPLLLDTTFLPRQENATSDGFSMLAGFQVRDDEGKIVVLSAVEIESPTRLRLRFVRPLPAGRNCTVSYGYPATAALGVIIALRSGPDQDGQPTAEIVVKGRFADKLKPLTDEGAFFVVNTLGRVQTRAPIRRLLEENGDTVLRYEPRELRDGTPFVTGQDIAAMRPFSYGNLRDSDPEASVHTFADTTYGTRAGKPYPLWNWCVLFSQFKVEAPKAQ
jgi:hypothetical protein